MYQFNPTQVVGLLSFGVTAALCFAVWRSAQNVKSTWAWLAIAYAAMAIDVILGGRYLISKTLRTMLKSADLYQNRRFWQIVVIILLLALVVAITRKMLSISRHQSDIIKKAIYATVLTLIFFIVESISLHKIDAILYHKAGPILLIGWIWATLATLMAFICICALRRHSELHH